MLLFLGQVMLGIIVGGSIVALAIWLGTRVTTWKLPDPQDPPVQSTNTASATSIIGGHS